MTRKKNPKGTKRATKVAKRKAKKKQHSASESPLGSLSMLSELPVEVRRMMLASILGEDTADELLGSYAIEDIKIESGYDAKTERLLARADAARRVETQRARLQDLVEHNPDCIEGWAKLAESQDRPEEAVPFYEQAIAAAERALPADCKSGELDRHVEGVRTYIWTLRDLMECLKAAHRLDEAISVGQEVLRREPDDHTATRHVLLGLLLEVGRHEEAESLLDAYPDEMFAEWPFGRLLLAIQTRASETKREKLLKQAQTTNPHVLDYLLDRIPMPVEMPPLVEIHEQSGAVFCVAHLRKAWVSTPGAISWLREAAGKAKLLKRHPPQDKRGEGSDHPFDLLVDRDILDLPPHPEPVWLAGIQELPAVHRPGRKRKKKVWALYAFTENGPVGCDVREQRPNATDLWQWLLETMSDGEPPGRPERITFPQKGICRQLRIKSIRTGVDIDVCEEPPPLEPLFEKMAQQLDWEGRAHDVSEEDILALPQDPTDVWQCDLANLDKRLINDQGELQRAINVLVASARDDLVLAQEISTGEPDDETLLKILRQAMIVPLIGESHRPAEVVVRHEDDRLLLQETLEKWNITVRVDSQLDVVDRMREEIAGLFKSGGPGGLHSDPEITNDDLAEFYESACRLFQSRPWQRWLEDDVIRIDCPAVESQPFYALVMGQSGIETGLSLFDDRRIPVRLFQGDGEEAMREISGYSLNFEEEQAVPVADLDAINQFGWPIATPEGYPVAFRINKGPDFAALTRAELQMLTALMTALDSLTSRREEPVEATCGEVTVTCTYDGQAR